MCDNCGKNNCNCDEYESETNDMKRKFVPMSDDEKMRKVVATVTKWNRGTIERLLKKIEDE
jgi:hypothetical protein